MEKGNLSINSENILPIIKKWLYSDADIFVRELVSNGADAITKLKKLVDLGEVQSVPKDEKYFIKVYVDKQNKLIMFEDNGIGMTADEIKQYINQIAFSGASDFLNKYKDRIDKNNEIIGHFGLGFYSSFMIADKVQIDTLSYQDGAEPATWTCDGGIEYEMSPGQRLTRGTTITLYVNEESKDFLEEYKLRGILQKYCGFIPVEIYLEEFKPVDEAAEVEADADTDEVIVEDDVAEDGKDKPDNGPKPINDVSPLWLKAPNECTDEEYKAFYHKVFMDFNEPLFWIHLNMDYPFRLKGILYFPKLKHELESIEGQVKLYNNQVFIADNIKEVIPEFLLLLKGTLDCPDLPLNVSRSFLQNDGYVTKMSGYISRKVADKLNSIFKKDRAQYNSYWDDIAPFIKYGCIKEKDFYEKIKDAVVYKTINGEYFNLTEYTEKQPSAGGADADKTVYYVSNEQQQAQYIKMFKDNAMEAVVLTTALDNPFMSYIESYEKGLHFNRIDSSISDALKNNGEAATDTDASFGEELQKLFRTALGNDKLKVTAENLKSDGVSAIMLLSEQSRRMQEMSKMFGGGLNMPNMFESDETLVLNKNNGLVKSLFNIKDDESRKDDAALICAQLYDLALMSLKPLGVDEMTRFIERSNKILERIV